VRGLCAREKTSLRGSFLPRRTAAGNVNAAHDTPEMRRLDVTRRYR
jgi:hypothetical protein